jgi:hypothetical protein
MRPRFDDVRHLLRVGLVFVVSVLAFVAARRALIPSDFGVYGHYRAGALTENRARPVHFAGQKACVECHADVDDTRKDSPHARVSCEVCHGPLAPHAAGDENAPTPARADGRLPCLTCHRSNGSAPATFKQIVLVDHADEGPCIACHQPHSPRIE